MANIIIYGKQCTILLYADDNKLLHVYTNVITDILEEINNYFGDLVISRGNTHGVFVITIKIRNYKKVELIKKHHIEDTVIQFKHICGFKVTSPCAHNLWGVNNEAELLDYIKSYLFHLLTYKLLYITKRTIPDIEKAVVLFTKRVSHINVDDWKKLRRCISYLNQTVDDVSIIGCFNLKYFLTWVDVSYAIHTNMHIQTGGVMSINYVMLCFLSSKQNLNANFLTEAELIGTSEYVTFNVWLVIFM